MANNNETLADIAAEIRQAVESMGDDLPCTISAGTVRRVADRIEAVAKRDAAIHAMTVEANERLREHLEIAIENDKRTAVGNAEAMRDIVTALAAVILPPRDRAGEDGWLAWVRAMQGQARAALAAPPRNCDTPYKDRVEMYGAFKDWCKAKGHTMEPMLAYDAFEWFLAPATERKGGGDEQK